MTTISKEIMDIIAKSDMVVIVTTGVDGPHTVATWGSYVADLDMGDAETLLIPAGGYRQTGENLESDDRITLVIGTKQVQGTRGMGIGYRLSGNARLETDGPLFDRAKEKFPWARAVLVVKVKTAEQLI